MTIQYMTLAVHVTLNINKNMSMASVFLDIEKDFDKTWPSSLLNKWSELEFLRSLIKLIAPFPLTETLKSL
jgi:hypothetical protein